MLKSPLQVGYPEEKIQESVALFPILRAGLGLIPGFQAMFPVDAKTYHIGLYREKSTFLPVEYYNKLPGVCATDVGFVLDPMIATAGEFLIMFIDVCVCMCMFIVCICMNCMCVRVLYVCACARDTRHCDCGREYIERLGSEEYQVLRGCGL